MAIYTPDYKYAKAKTLIEEMPGEQGDLVRYYISQHEKWHKNLQAQNDEMREVFKGIGKFIK